MGTGTGTAKTCRAGKYSGTAAGSRVEALRSSLARPRQASFPPMQRGTRERRSGARGRQTARHSRGIICRSRDRRRARAGGAPFFFSLFLGARLHARPGSPRMEICGCRGSIGFCVAHARWWTQPGPGDSN